MLDVIRRLGVFPRFCVLELTLRCNFRCMHCGSFAGTPREDELSTEEWLEVADALGELQCAHVTLGGGEPTLFKDWPLIAKRLLANGVQVNMVTNGRTWTDETTQLARDAGLANVAFSLDGLEETHDRTRRSPGSFRRIMAAFDSCHAAGFQVAAITAINKQNMAELPELRRVLAEARVEQWQFQLGTPAGHMTENPELVVEPEDLLTIIPLLASFRHMKGLPRMVATDNVGYYGRFERDLRHPKDSIGFWTGCRAGLQTLGIESNGNVKGCLSLPSERHERHNFVEGNLRDTSLAELWNAPDGFAYTRQFTTEDLGGFCKTCPYNDICRGGCTWLSYSSSGFPRENPYCFYRVAVEHGRFDLLDDEDAAAVGDAP